MFYTSLKNKVIELYNRLKLLSSPEDGMIGAFDFTEEFCKSNKIRNGEVPVVIVDYTLRNFYILGPAHLKNKE